MELVNYNDVSQLKNSIFDCIDVTENTRKEYLTRIKHFIHFVKLHGINFNTYLEYKRYLSSIDTLSVSTKNKYLISAKIFIDGLNNLQQFPFQINTKVRGFKQSKLHKKDGLCDEDISKIVDYCFSLEPTIQNLRLKSILSLLIFQGLRQVEITRLNVTDINMKDKIAFIIGKGQDDKELIHLRPSTIKVLKEYLHTNRIREGALFRSGSNFSSGSRLTTKSIREIAPAIYKITNLSAGGSTYHWIFEGGEPSSYDGQNPPDITYANQGTYTIRLTVGNGSATFTSEQEISVRELLDASFSIIPSFEDIDDMEAPLRATFETQLQGVESLWWECSGTAITNNTSADAGIYFLAAGQYTVCLNVSNGKHAKRVSQNITVKENTNLRTHKDIKLGINTASETIGSLYSTKLRRVFKTSEINSGNGALIDIVFFGLNADFTYNQFVSPEKLYETALPEIPNAKPTKFINKTELSPIPLTPDQFNTMTTDALLKNLQISTVSYRDEFFTASPLPRVVLFETSDGRKGAILIKALINSGKESSYILTDIKIQKND